MNVDVVLKKAAKTAPRKMSAPHAAPFKQRYGAWGRVDKVYSNNHTADVYLDTGMFLKQVPVSSKEWVKPGDDYTTGQRDLPPENARVFVFMPYGDYDGCFVLCSGFVVTDKAQKQAFMEDEKERIRGRVFPGNWKTEYHYPTGTFELVSPDEKTSLKIDYGTEQEAKDPPELHLKLFDKIKADVVSDGSITLSAFDDEVKIEHKKGDNAKVTVFDTELTIKNGEVSVKPKKTTIEVDGDSIIKTSGNTTIEASGDTILKGNNVTVESAVNLTLKTGDAMPWMPNIMPVCPFGPIHGGAMAGIVKLKGG